MPRTKDQYDEIRSATKRKIQAAGLKLFSHKGYAATSISDIASLAGISTGLMYRHYISKEELFSELVNNAVEAMSEITQLLDLGGSPAAAIQNLTQVLLATLAQSDETGQYFVLIIQFFLSGTAAIGPSEIQYGDFLLFNRMSKRIEEGQQLGEFRSGNPLQMAMFYFSSIQGIGISSLVDREHFIIPSTDMVTAFLMKETGTTTHEE